MLGEAPRLCENVGPRLRSTHVSAGAETSSGSEQQQSAVPKVTISDVLSSADILFFVP